MDIMRDKNTKKEYIHNMPVGQAYIGKNKEGKVYKIVPESFKDDVWYNGKFIGTRYCVCVRGQGFWQQISPWYLRYGYALAVLNKCVLASTIEYVGGTSASANKVIEKTKNELQAKYKSIVISALLGRVAKVALTYPDKMAEFYASKICKVVKISGGRLIVIDTPVMQKSYCFGYDATQESEDRADEKVHKVRTDKEYVKKINIEDTIGRDLKQLKYSMFTATTPEYKKYTKEGLTYHFIVGEVFREDVPANLVDVMPLTEEDKKLIYDAYAEVEKEFVARMDRYLARYGTTKFNVWSYLSD